jgi:hypothetical protein
MTSGAYRGGGAQSGAARLLLVILTTMFFWCFGVCAALHPPMLQSDARQHGRAGVRHKGCWCMTSEYMWKRPGCSIHRTQFFQRGFLGVARKKPTRLLRSPSPLPAALLLAPVANMDLVDTDPGPDLYVPMGGAAGTEAGGGFAPVNLRQGGWSDPSSRPCAGTGRSYLDDQSMACRPPCHLQVDLGEHRSGLLELLRRVSQALLGWCARPRTG